MNNFWSLWRRGIISQPDEPIQAQNHSSRNLRIIAGLMALGLIATIAVVIATYYPW